MNRTLYSVVITLLTPVMLGHLLWQSRKNPQWRKRWRERFGFVPVSPEQQQGIWIHATSVGEFIAAIPLIKACLQEFPAYPITITNTTPTGAAQVKAVFGDSVHQLYIPWDLNSSVKRFVKRLRPAYGIIMETELWPNLLSACADRVPLVLVNARLSARSARRYTKMAAMVKTMLQQFKMISAQNRSDARRFKILGADRVITTGSIKYDLDISTVVLEKAQALKARFGTRPVWIAASTHDIEEAMILDAHRQLQQRIPNLALIIVPRHAERFTVVAELIRTQGFSLERRTESATAPIHADIFLGDTMGELLVFYGASDVAFIGGSLIPRGGHNMLEAAALGLPCITGPHIFNFKDIHRSLSQIGALKTVMSTQEVVEWVTHLFQDTDDRRKRGEIAKQSVIKNRGALSRNLQLLKDFIG